MGIFMVLFSLSICHQSLKATAKNLDYVSPGVFYIRRLDDTAIHLFPKFDCFANLTPTLLDYTLHSIVDIRCRDADVENTCPGVIEVGRRWYRLMWWVYELKDFETDIVSGG